MPRNEIKTAQAKSANYYLHFVCLDNCGSSLYIINPFETLHLETVFDIAFSNELALLQIESVEIKLVDLDRFITISDFTGDVVD